ncbi:uncharacterized protein LOC143571171 [Bidens hawaiensis]|uniref:uncharacterized protein LOC143571171 n=1 Tax=Bidens hawaiensis TaxID=980011 RepID=UPI00404BA1CF
MLETELYSSRIFSHFREDCGGDEELSLLPRHTKVIVTGNNRTKSVLVGLQGIVKKAVGLGGWHWLVLKNGVEVKLQRNALSVLEPPTGQEDDGDFELADNSSCGSDDGEKDNIFSAAMEFSKPSKPRVRYTRPWSPPRSMKPVNCSGCKENQSNNHLCHSCVLVRDLGLMFFDTNKNSRCSGPTTQHANQTQLTPLIKHGYCFQVLKNGVEVKLQRNALSVLEPPTGQEDDGDFELDDNSSCGSDDGEKDNIFSAAMEFSKPSKPRVRYTRPWSPPRSMKPVNRSGCKENQSNNHLCHSKVNFAKLGSNTLGRYYSTFNLGNIHSNPTKEQLVNAIQKHFASQKVSEVEVIMEFIHAAKRQKSERTKKDQS